MAGDAQAARDRLAALLHGNVFIEHGLQSTYVTIRLLDSRASALADEIEQGRAAREALARALDALADCVIKATERGAQDGDFIGYYWLPTGPIHRAIPLLQEHGITVRPGFDGRALAATDADAVEATKQRTLIDQHWSGPLVRPPTGTDAGQVDRG